MINAKQPFIQLIDEQREFVPSKQFSEQATVKDNNLYQFASDDPIAYWSERAQKLDWFAPWDTVLHLDPPHNKWFVNGTINLSYNCLDRHVNAGNGEKVAFYWESESGAQRVVTYRQMLDEVCKLANALKKLGVKKGDRVALYLPMIPEACVAMLACARIGAIHSVIFGGFSAHALADRINDAQCALVITADGSSRRGKPLSLKATVDQALNDCSSVKNVVVIKHFSDIEPTMQHGRDHWYHELTHNELTECTPEPMDAEDILFILYTSGTTGKPKGIIHTTGGYAVGAQTTTELVFDVKDADIFWCTADVGWITGHTYVTYGPMLNGVTQVMYEGALNYPQPDRVWQIIERYKITILYTAPTAIRMFAKYGDALPAAHDLSSLRLLGSVGEPLNPEAWIWYYTIIGQGRCPIVDTWWQTETGSIMLSGLPGVTVAKPGFVGPPLPGIQAAIVDEHGHELDHGSGLLVISKPWPSMLRGLWGDDERFRQAYFKHGDYGTYYPGDGATKTADGQYMIIGRLDDVLTVSGHRIGTMEVESALVSHPDVTEVAVIGRHHEIKGQSIVAFVCLQENAIITDRTPDELKRHVVEQIGAIARPEEIVLVAELPKTRSGKIMRRLLRDIAYKKTIGDTSTLADSTILDQLRQQYEDSDTSAS